MFACENGTFYFHQEENFFLAFGEMNCFLCSCVYSLNLYGDLPPVFKGIIWFLLRVSTAFTACLFRVTLDRRDIVQVQNDIRSGTSHHRLTFCQFGSVGQSYTYLVSDSVPAHC